MIGAQNQVPKETSVERPLYHNSERGPGQQDTEIIKIYKQDKEPKWSLVPVITQSQSKQCCV